MNLTERQLEVLHGLSQGLCNKSLGRNLGITELTAKNHVACLIRKFNVKNRFQVVWKAIELGLLPCPCPNSHISTGPVRMHVAVDMPQDPPLPDMIWLKVGDLLMCPESFRIQCNGAFVEMRTKEFQLLHFLARNLDRIFTRDKLLDVVWGTNIAVEDRTIDVHIRRVRLALGRLGLQDMVQTVKGFGYKAVKVGGTNGVSP